jgi:ribonucleoside-triphosphate reductase
MAKDLTITIKLSESYMTYFIARQQMELYLKYGANQKELYFPPINVTILDEGGFENITYTYYQLTPTNLSDFDLSYAAKPGSFNTFTWGFKYNYFDIYYRDENGNRVDKLYFTNSIHIPVYKQMSPFEKVDIESQLTGYSNAGCITYVEVTHDAVHNTEALEELVNYAMEKDIPYFAINLPADTCENCGYQGNIGDVCPKCGSDNISRLRRVTGYLTGNYTTAFNAGKQVETDQRVKHKDITNF